MPKTTTRTPKLDEARARAAEARRLAAALDALAALDLGDQLRRLEECDRQIASAKRTIERATRELATVRSTRSEIVDEVRHLVVGTGASPAQAADLLGLPASLCGVPATRGADEADDADEPNEPNEAEVAAEPEPEAWAAS